MTDPYLSASRAFRLAVDAALDSGQLSEEELFTALEEAITERTYPDEYKGQREPKPPLTPRIVDTPLPEPAPKPPRPSRFGDTRGGVDDIKGW